MRLLLVHTDYLEFEVRQRDGRNDVAGADGAPVSGRMEECVTAFVTVERADAADTERVVANAADELRDVTDQLNTDRVVLYPSAHLSDDPAESDLVRTVLPGVGATLVDEGYDVLRAPDGRDTSVEVSCKGHPFATQSRHVCPDRDDATPGPDREPGEWYVVRPDGTREDATATGESLGADLRALLAAELEDAAAGEAAGPGYVELLEAQSLAGSDDGSGGSTLRWYPRGTFVRDAVTEYVRDLVVEYGGMPVGTLFAAGAGTIEEPRVTTGEHDHRSGSGDRRTAGLPAGWFDQLSVLRDVRVAASDLPVRIYGTVTCSVRPEQRGDAAGSGHPQAVTIPMMHTVTADVESARAEFLDQVRLAVETCEGLGLSVRPVLRVTRAFYEDNSAWAGSVAERLGTPTLLEVLPEGHHSWAAAVDLATADGPGRPSGNPTVGIDLESAQRFDVTVGDDGRHPPVVQCSPSGGIEQVVAALLEAAETADRPRLPTWLSPTQVRLVPVTGNHLAYCDRLVEDMTAAGIRADVDDRAETVGSRVARAEADWVPYYAVVGDPELDGGDLGVTVCETGREVAMTPEELRTRVSDEVAGFPAKRRYLPAHVSDHPTVTGQEP